MGNCSFRAEGLEQTESTSQNKNLFNFHCVIGRGGFGKVWRVEKKKT